jgi:hypothetical protein
MTKTEARKRAKVRAAKKFATRKSDPDQPEQKTFYPGRFDPGTNSIKGTRANTHTRSFAEGKRGAARSR